MKKLFLLTLMVSFPFVKMTAQDYGDNASECMKFLSYYEEYFKQRAYDAALPNWREAYKACPRDSRQSIYSNGAFLLKRVINKTFDPVYRQALLDSLMTLYDERIQYFPKSTVTALNKKGGDIFRYMKNDDRKMYEELGKIIDANREKTDLSFFTTNFIAAAKLYQSGQLTAEEVMDVYQRNGDILKDIADSNAVKKSEELDKLFVSMNVASCDDLVSIYTPKFQADPENISLVRTIVKTLGNVDGGVGTDLFFNAVTKMHDLDPSYQAAYYLYKLNAGKGNEAEAVELLEEAIEYPDVNNGTKASYCYELAAYCYKIGMSSKAIANATKAASLDESYAGKSYMIIANVWGSSKCGGDEISSRAHFWVATDYLIKARNADPSLAEEANRLIARYSAGYPENGEAFMYGYKNGESYTVNCAGMSAVTTVRTR